MHCIADWKCIDLMKTFIYRWHWTSSWCSYTHWWCWSWTDRFFFSNNMVFFYISFFKKKKVVECIQTFHRSSIQLSMQSVYCWSLQLVYRLQAKTLIKIMFIHWWASSGQQDRAYFSRGLGDMWFNNATTIDFHGGDALFLLWMHGMKWMGGARRRSFGLRGSFFF